MRHDLHDVSIIAEISKTDFLCKAVSPYNARWYAYKHHFLASDRNQSLS
jgi:hypothetical protein